MYYYYKLYGIIQTVIHTVANVSLTNRRIQAIVVRLLKKKSVADKRHFGLQKKLLETNYQIFIILLF